MKNLKLYIVFTSIFFISAYIGTSCHASDSASTTKLPPFAILCYSKPNPQIVEWMEKRFSYKISGAKPNTADMKWMSYIDIYGIGSLAEYLEMKDFALTNKLRYEDMLLHAKQNYSSKINVAFKNMDMFDVFEGKNGVLQTSNNTSFKDLTSTAFNGKVTLRDTVYIGYEEPFAEISMKFISPGKQVKSSLRFWNGDSWQPLPAKDGTELFTQNGTITFTPPTQWVTKSINNSRSKYFVQIKVEDADTFPVTSKIFGDNWLNGSGNACRGWDPLHSTVDKNALIPYNPSPPANASAKFAYQSRISFWGANHFIANPADKQNGERSWPHFLAERIVNSFNKSSFSGVMCDDGERNIAADGIAAEQTDLTDKSRNSWAVESASKYADLISLVKQRNPNIMMGINGQSKGLVTLSDWNLAEYHTGVWQTGSPLGIESSKSSTDYMSYDDYLPANNPNGIVGVLIYQDTTDAVPSCKSPWDRGNRGPIAALSKHYIGKNENTIFSYYSKGGFIYSETDEVVLKNGTILHQSVDPLPAIDNVKRWGTYFPAMAVDIGSSDTKGYNGGVRSLTWRKGKDLGGRADIWRRDFTRALVLHRPAFWSTPASEYEMGSPQLELNGAYYPLRADGTTGPPTTTISLRSGEGAILMKEPVLR